LADQTLIEQRTNERKINYYLIAKFPLQKMLSALNFQSSCVTFLHLSTNYLAGLYGANFLLSMHRNQIQAIQHIQYIYI